MSNVYTNALLKVQAQLPNQIGDNGRWTTATVRELLLAADRATRDQCEVNYGSVEISLTDDTISYDVASSFISITKVEFALDGTTYDWILHSLSMTDLDRKSSSWRTDRSTRPDFFTLLSAPGVQDNGDAEVPSQILLYPSLLSAGSAKIKITGVVIPAAGQFASAEAPNDVQASCHVPYVLSVLYAVESPEKAAMYFKKFKQGCEIVRNRFRSQYKNHPQRPGSAQYSNTWSRT